MCKKQDTAVISKVNKLFNLEVIVMGVMLSLVGWGSLQIVANNSAVAGLTAKHIVLDRTYDVIFETRESVIRMEMSQIMFAKSVSDNMTKMEAALANLSNNNYKPVGETTQ